MVLRASRPASRLTAVVEVVGSCEARDGGGRCGGRVLTLSSRAVRTLSDGDLAIAVGIEAFEDLSGLLGDEAALVDASRRRNGGGRGTCGGGVFDRRSSETTSCSCSSSELGSPPRSHSISLSPPVTLSPNRRSEKPKLPEPSATRYTTPFWGRQCTVSVVDSAIFAGESCRRLPICIGPKRREIPKRAKRVWQQGIFGEVLRLHLCGFGGRSWCWGFSCCRWR
ncbi:hypothetical protein TB2_027657 [Malus domestica]